MLDLCCLDISFTAVDRGDHDPVYEVLCYIFILECHESETSRLARVDILQDASINHFTELLEVTPQFFDLELEVEPADEDLAARVLESDLSVSAAPLLGLGNRIGVGLLESWCRNHADYRESSSHGSGEARWEGPKHGLLLLMIVIGRLDVNLLLENVMAWVSILGDHLLLHPVRLLLILEDHLDEAEAAATHSGLIPHDDLVDYLSELRKVVEEIVFYIINLNYGPTYLGSRTRGRRRRA